MRLKALQRQVEDKDDWKMIDYVIRAISYSEKMPSMYKNKNNLEEFLAVSSPGSIKLIQRITEIEHSTDVKGGLSSEIGEVINTLKKYADQVRHKILFQMLDTTQTLFSDFDLVKYLEQIIDFYKSYTQDLYSTAMSYKLIDLNEGMKITEKLTTIFNLEDWEQVTWSLIFTSNTNEFLSMVKDLWIKKEKVRVNEVLHLIERTTRDLRLIGKSQ